MRIQDKCGPDPDTTSVVAMVTDTCPECEANHIDMQARIFAAVSCPVPMPAARKFSRCSSVCRMIENSRQGPVCHDSLYAGLALLLHRMLLPFAQKTVKCTDCCGT